MPCDATLRATAADGCCTWEPPRHRREPGATADRGMRPRGRTQKALLFSLLYAHAV